MRFHKGTTLRDRFLMNVIIPENEDSCWIWIGVKNWGGYGVINNEIGKKEPAHRISYRLYISNFDRNLWVLHHCDNPACVNPKHLFLGTRSDNMIDMWNKNRHSTINMGRPSESMIGENNINSKLSEQDVIQIRNLYKSGIKQRELSKVFNIKPAAIWKIIHNYTWKYLYEL